MWYRTNLLGAWRLIRRRPQLAPVIVRTCSRRAWRLILRTRTLGWSPPPEQITVLVTDVCNLRCKMCHYAASDDPSNQLNRAGAMPPELFRQILDGVPGHPIVVLTGGEPLLHPQITEFIAYARHKGRFCTLTTNGWMLADQAEALCASGLDILAVSVDGPPEVHDRIRGRGSFDRLARGVEAVLRQARRPIVFLTMAITDINDGCLMQVYQLAQDWGADGLNFNHLWLQTDDMVNDHNTHLLDLFAADRVAWSVLPSAVDVGQVADQVEAIRRRNSGSAILVTEIPNLSREEISAWYSAPHRAVKYCTTHCAWVRLRVAPDGSVMPCRGWSVGSVRTEPPMVIWNGSKFRRLRQTLAARGMLPICARCCELVRR